MADLMKSGLLSPATMAQAIETLSAALDRKTEECIVAQRHAREAADRAHMYRETNRRIHRRLQLLEGWWQRKLGREKYWHGVFRKIAYGDCKAIDLKALEEAAYQRGFEDGRDERFNTPPRRVVPRKVQRDAGGGNG